MPTFHVTPFSIPSAYFAIDKSSINWDLETKISIKVYIVAGLCGNSQIGLYLPLALYTEFNHPICPFSVLHYPYIPNIILSILSTIIYLPSYLIYMMQITYYMGWKLLAVREIAIHKKSGCCPLKVVQSAEWRTVGRQGFRQFGIHMDMFSSTTSNILKQSQSQYYCVHWINWT